MKACSQREAHMQQRGFEPRTSHQQDLRTVKPATPDVLSDDLPEAQGVFGSCGTVGLYSVLFTHPTT